MRILNRLSISYVILLVLSTFLPGELAAQHGKIAIFGSSVANGTGDTTGAGGYAGRIISIMKSSGWEAVNVSRGGDNTISIMPRFESQLLPVKPDYVILGLSLGNEGIYSNSELIRNRVFESYRSGMLRLIQLCRESGIYPIVANCYARDDFGEEHYALTRKMNLIINTWDVPSINLLGAINNGKGGWLEGYAHDVAHPDYKGHREMFYSFVPSLFDAIRAGKNVPFKIRSNRYLNIKGENSRSPLTYSVNGDTIHSFSLSFVSRTSGTGTIAALRYYKGSSVIKMKKDRIEYISSKGDVVESTVNNENDGWQYVVVSHQFASGKTDVFINGKLSGSIHEEVLLKDVIIGGNGNIDKYPNAPNEASYRDLLIYRSGLNSDEVNALYYDQLLQSSLEIYAPLNDENFRNDGTTANYAQSLSEVKISGDSLMSKED